MQHLRNSSINSILESSGGIHISVYLKNTGNKKELDDQIKSTLITSENHLAPILTKEEIKKILEPLYKLKNDSNLHHKFEGNFGVFRTINTFRMINLPIQLEHICIIATSFHVKPLLVWAQTNQDFYLIGAQEEKIYLYKGNQKSFENINKILSFDTSNESIDTIKEWILCNTSEKNTLIYFAGNNKIIHKIQKVIDFPHAIKSPVSDVFSKNLVTQIVTNIRKLHLYKTNELYEKFILEYYWAENKKLARKNLFQISKAAIQGRVKKLIIAEEVYVFGTIDKKTGGLSLNPTHLNHEDDDILDDLAQAVFSLGGEVIVAPRNQIPENRPILAILNDEPYKPIAELTQNLKNNSVFDKSLKQQPIIEKGA